MKIFVSYSVGDTSLVAMIVSYLRLQGHSVDWWHQSRLPGKETWPQIYGWIDSADLVLAVITDNTVARAMAVGNEVGRAKAKSKMIIPLVAQSVQTSDLGCLSDLVQIRFNPQNPWPAILELQRYTQPPAVRAAGQPTMSPAAGLIAVGALIFLVAALSSE